MLLRVLALLVAILVIAVATPLDTAAFARPETNWPGLAGDWRSGIKVQNLSDRAGTVTIEFVNDQGETVGDPVSQSLPASSSIEVYLTTVAIPNGRYSAVVRADVPIAAVATQTNYGAGLADSYNASTGASSIGVPYVYRGINDWYTTIFVQNASDATTTVSVRVEASGVSPVVVSAAIPAKATHVFDVSSSAFDALGSGFRGAATVTSNEGASLAVAAFHIRNYGTVHVMTSMKGSEAANTGAQIALPSLYRLLNNWRSGIQVYNPSASDTVQVTLTFRLDQDYLNGGPWTKSGISLGPRQSYEFYLATNTVDGGSLLPDAFRGSAMVAATGAVQASVIHTNYDRDVAMGYVGVAADAATSRLAAPSLYGGFGYGPWNSGIKVQNLSASASATVNFTFRADEGVLDGGTWRRTGVVLPPLGSFEYYVAATALDGGSPLPAGFRGSAVIEATGASAGIVGTVIHTNYTRRVANMYTAINY